MFNKKLELSDALNVAVVQMTSVDKLQKNVSAILETLRSLRGKNTDLVVFPENSLYLRIDKNKPLPVVTMKDAFWSELAKATDDLGADVFVGTFISLGARQKNANAIVHLSPGKKPKIVYEKIHLFDVDVVGAPPSRESDVFKHGMKPAIVNVKGWKIGMSICYDIRFSELYNKYARKGVDAIIIPSAFLVPTGHAHWHVLNRARAIECQCYVVSPAQSGRHQSGSGVRETFGHSMVVDPWGHIKQEALGEGPAILNIKLSKAEIAKVRKQIPMASHRRIK